MKALSRSTALKIAAVLSVLLSVYSIIYSWRGSKTSQATA